jgi:hypothetical protein
VVDGETGKPIEGAIVVAHWQLRGATLDSGTRQNQLEVVETVTDINGRFFIPGFTKINFTLEQLREEDPRVVIFKPGFSIAGGHNSYPIGAPGTGAHRSSPLRGKRIEVKSLSGDLDRYLRELSLVSATLSDLSASGDLGSVPKLIRAMVCEKRRLKSVSSQKFLLSVPGETGSEADCEVN